MNRNIHIGRQGELFAASVLESYDIRTHHVDIERDDLWAKTPSNKFFSVQVKSASFALLHSSHHTLKRYSFALHEAQNFTGIFIFVALDIKMILARLGTTVNTKTLKIKPSDFTKQAQDQTVSEAFQL